MAASRFALLHSGCKMPTIGLGTYLSTGQSTQTAIDCAIDVGYRHIDTAVAYGNHQGIGDALSQKFLEGKLKRKDIFITTKVPPIYLDSKDTRVCVEKSLDELKLSYLDMVLIHTPWGLVNRGDGTLKPKDSKGDLECVAYNLNDTWHTLETLVKEGLIKNIGVSNFTVKLLDQIWEKAKVKPSNVQLECHVYLQQRELRKYCESKNIIVTGYCPLGNPGRLEQHRHNNDSECLLDPIVLGIGKSLNRTPAQILLRYLMQISVVPLPKSLNPARIEGNFKLWDFDLSDENMQKLASLNKNHKFFRFLDLKGHPFYPTKGQPF